MFSTKRLLLLILIGSALFSGVLFLNGHLLPTKIASKPAVLQSSTYLFDSLNQAQKDCIRADLGDSLYQALNQGTATPTTYEQGVIDNCTNSGGTSSTSSTGSGSGTSCGSGYYWDSTSSSCKPNPTSTSCGSGYYWDSTSSSCKPNPTSTSGTVTCPSGWTYNATVYNGSGGCVQYSGSTIICGSGYSWNGTYCLSTTSSGSGSSGSSTSCSGGYYWNGSYCAPNSSTSPTAWACPTGWIYNATAYNGSGGCIQNSGGTVTCGSGYTWNGSSCVSNNSTTSTSSPYYSSSGSTYIPYSGLDPKLADCWKAKIGQSRYDLIRSGSPVTAPESDSMYQCYSQNISTTTTQTTTYTTGYVTYSTGGVRLADKAPERNCFQKNLGVDFDWFNNLANPSATREYQKFENLMKRVQICFNNASTTQITNLQQPKIFISPEIVSCFKSTVGEARFNEIMANSSSVSPTERASGESCYSKIQGEKRTEVEYKTSAKLDPNVESCLKLAVGEVRFKDISLGGSKPEVREIAKGNTCFGIVNTPIAPPATYKLDSKINDCITSSLTPNQLDRIIKGELKPTETEKEKVTSCFKDINQVQKNFLPLPPTQVPFLASDNQKVLIEKTQTTYQKNNTGKDTPTVTFSGRGSPNETVDLYLFSDPVVVT